MNEGRRAYNLLRAYVGREWDRIKSWERQDALKELEETLPPPKEQSEEDQEKTVIYIPSGSTREEAARHILGVAKDAPFVEVRKAFERLSKRADPSKFVENSPEQKQAHDIQKKIHWAYRVLTEKTSETEKRFGSLEID